MSTSTLYAKSLSSFRISPGYNAKACILVVLLIVLRLATQRLTNMLAILMGCPCIQPSSLVPISASAIDTRSPTTLFHLPSALICCFLTISWRISFGLTCLQTSASALKLSHVLACSAMLGHAVMKQVWPCASASEIISVTLLSLGTLCGS